MYIFFISSGALKCSETEATKVQGIQLMSSSRMSLKGILTKTKQSQTSLATNEIVEPLKDTVQDLENHIQALTDRVATLRS